MIILDEGWQRLAANAICHAAQMAGEEARSKRRVVNES